MWFVLACCMYLLLWGTGRHAQPVLSRLVFTTHSTPGDTDWIAQRCIRVPCCCSCSGPAAIQPPCSSASSFRIFSSDGGEGNGGSVLNFRSKFLACLCFLRWCYFVLSRFMSFSAPPWKEINPEEIFFSRCQCSILFFLSLLFWVLGVLALLCGGCKVKCMVFSSRKSIKHGICLSVHGHWQFFGINISIGS
jgi:hypothetical protein